MGGEIEATRDTVYDLASLTKVIVTTTLALWLVDQRRWHLDDLVAPWVPGLERDDLTLWHLLTHTSGLVAHRPFFLVGRQPRLVRRAVLDEAARGGPLGEVLYSDLNFMLLGWAVARCAGRPLDLLFRDVVAAPLAMRRTRFRPLKREREGIAATEVNGDQRPAPEAIWGEVHDGNAWSLGGVAGHAGLFGPADDVAAFVAALLHPRSHPVLRSSTVAAMTAYQAGASTDERALGWRLRPEGWGPWPADTYWHTGFTGTSLLVSPTAGLAVVLLTNAIHPRRQLTRQATYRAAVHQAIVPRAR